MSNNGVEIIVRSMDDYKRIANAIAKTNPKAAQEYMDGAYVRRRVAIAARDSLANTKTFAPIKLA